MGRMEIDNRKEKVKSKGLIQKALERCRIRSRRRTVGMPPEGCLSVCVGPARERLMVRTEWLNHPLFKELLEEAEMEFGYATAGPLELPCDVALFRRVLWEVEQEAEQQLFSPRCNFAIGHAAAGYFQLLSPVRPMNMITTGGVRS